MYSSIIHCSRYFGTRAPPTSIVWRQSPQTRAQKIGDSQGTPPSTSSRSRAALVKGGANESGLKISRIGGLLRMLFFKSSAMLRDTMDINWSQLRCMVGGVWCSWAVKLEMVLQTQGGTQM